MCTNAVKTAASLMAAIEPTLKSLLTYTGLIDTTAGKAVIAAYDSALAAVQGWQSGTPAQEVLEVISAFQSAFSVLPLPAAVETLGNIILAGIETVIGVLSANSPAPAAPVGIGADATEEEIQVGHQAHVIADTTTKVQTLVPTFQRSIWHSAASQYTKAWNEAVSAGVFPSTLAA